MMKKLLLTFMFVLPLCSHADMPTQAEQAANRAQARAAWKNMSKDDKEATYQAQENHRLSKRFPDLSYDDAKIMDKAETCQIWLGITGLYAAKIFVDLTYNVPKFAAQDPILATALAATAGGCILAIGALEAGKYFARNYFFKSGKTP